MPETHLLEDRICGQIAELRRRCAELDEQYLKACGDKSHCDGADGAVDTQLVADISAQAARARSELAQAEAMLARVKAGTYGKCQQCGAGINPDRLMVLPNTTLCGPCAGAKA